MISIILTFIVLVLVIVYLALGLYPIPYEIYKAITDPNYGETKVLIEGLLFVLVIALILSLIAYLYSKINYYSSFMNSVKIFAIIAIPVFYIVLLSLSYITKSRDKIDLLLFKNGADLSDNIIEIIAMYDAFTTYPVLISSFVFKVFAEKRELKDFESEQKYIREEKKKQEKIDNTNKEIEYYKKVSELDQLLKQETITQEKYNELKNSLDSQYNKNI